MKKIIKNKLNYIYEKSKDLYQIPFNPPKINDESNIHINININNIPKNSYQEINEINDEENKIKSFIKESSLYQEKSRKFNTFVKERDKSREKFLDSISILIKRILLQCNYIITNELEEEKYSNIQDNYKNFSYPIIEEPCNNETYLNFIKNMDSILLKYYNIDKFTETNLILFDLVEDLSDKMDEIFHFKNKLGDLEKLSYDSSDNPFSSENINNYTNIIKTPNDVSYINVEDYYAFINSRYNKKKKRRK